jgi:magnesium-transporting ATPase (P-type)
MNTITYPQISVLKEEQALSSLVSVRSGLGDEQVAEKKEIFGENVIKSKQLSWVTIFLRQFKSAFIYLLLAASLVSFFLGDSKIDAALIFLFLLINAILGFFQEYRAEHALQLLKSYVDRKTRVRRNGVEKVISIKDVVPGDIVLLDAGDTIPADGYFLKADDVTVDESAMTGETSPVKKSHISLEVEPNDIY